MAVNNKDHTDSANELTPISSRERRLREELAGIDEDLARGEIRLRHKSELRRNRLIRKINKDRQRHAAKIDRLERSRIYKKTPFFYWALSPLFFLGRLIKTFFSFLLRKHKHHQQVTNHRSFYLTTRNQSVRQINITNYSKFIGEVWHFIWDHKFFYLKILLIVSMFFLVFAGYPSYTRYSELREAFHYLDQSGQFGGYSWIAALTGLTTQAFIGSFNIVDANKQVFASVFFTITWLTLIYGARKIYGGYDRLTLREAVYNSGGPLAQSLTLGLLMVIQMVPLAIFMLVYSSASGAGYINSGIAIENMAAWSAIAVFSVLTLYWLMTTLISLITVTIPGIYPMRAYFETSVLLFGRRLKVLLRLIVMFMPLAVIWILFVMPIIYIDYLFNLGIVVQIATSIIGGMFMIWTSTYIYILYRRLLDSPSQSDTVNSSFFGWIKSLIGRHRKHLKKKVFLGREK